MFHNSRLLLIVLFSIIPFAFYGKGGVENSDIIKLVDAQNDYVLSLRKHFHLYPELGGEELETAKFIKSEVKKIGNDLSVHEVPGSTGFYVILETGRSGKTIGLRTDIDGLPIIETATNGGGKSKKYVSLVNGVTQGCGHDGHMAILLGTMKIIHELKDKLSGRFVFIFEEGEETNSGIRPMVDALRNIHFDAIYGNHVASNVPTGKIYIKEGPIMAGMATLSYHVVGKGGHASRPDLSVNPVFAAANILSGISIAWNNQRDITKLVTLGVTQLQGGKVYNVIPDSVYIGGTLRFFDPQAGIQALELVKRVSTTIAEAHGCQVAFDEKMKVDLPPVENDTTLALLAKKAVGELFPGSVTDDPRYSWYASETFTLYSELAPVVFTLVGVNSEEVGSTAQHHSAQFDLDEKALKYGVGAMVKTALRITGNN